MNNGFGEDDDRRLLHAHFSGGGGATERRFAALRLMRDHVGLPRGDVGVVQGVLSELDFDCAAYADEHFARLLDAADPRLFSGEVAGRVTSGGYGHTVGRSIAFAYLPPEVEDGR